MWLIHHTTNKYRLIITKLVLVSLSVFIVRCSSTTPEISDSELIIRANEALTETILEDGSTPPVASRIYAYSNIAAYETIVALKGEKESLSKSLNDLTIEKIDLPKEKIQSELASIVAFCEVAKSIVYRDNLMDDYLAFELDSLFNSLSKITKEQSINFGKEMAKQIISWSQKDNFSETRKMPIYVPLGRVGTWVPTAPTYGDAVEPHWFKHRPFMMDSSAQFTTKNPVAFSVEPSSEFYKAVYEVYETVNNIDSNQIEIAKFWDCNPQMSQTKGHVMYKVRQITPGGHWIGITSIASKMKQLSYTETAYIHALVAISLADGFISAWHSKYANHLIRPETYINKYIDKQWLPKLETPPFPEYPSAHSVISGAASTVLENYFGKDFKYVDTVEDQYGLGSRAFNSFSEAAEEVAISRVFGGIHYNFASFDGLDQGKKLGGFIIEKE